MLQNFKQRQLINRRLDAGAYMELFLVSAITSVLAIRLFLELAGYPQVGGGGLHIAHMLWGGLLMLFSIMLLLCCLGRASERLAAVLGGIGFGTFIDEVGKFITSDNDYFFRPAIALIYILFVALFFFVRSIQSRQNFTEQEYLLNALRLIEEIAVRDLDERERRNAHLYLQRSGSENLLTKTLEGVLRNVSVIPARRVSLIEKIKNIVAGFYRRVARLWWFPFAIIAFFLGQLGIKLLYSFILVFIIGLGWNEILDAGIARRIVERFRHLSFIDGVEIGFSLLSGAFVLWGILRMRRSRITAFEWFARSILISILITQVFAFYKEQFSALFGLLLNIGVLIALRFGIEQERAT